MRIRAEIHSILFRLGLVGLPLQIYVMFLLIFLFSFGRSLAFPYLPMYMAGMRVNGGLEINPSLVGLMLMGGGVSSTFMLLVSGSLCDRFGRRKMMLVFLIPQIGLTVGFAYATSFPEFLTLYLVMMGLGAFYDPAYNAMIADLLGPERREEVYGLSYMIGNVGTMLAAPIGGVLVTVSRFPTLFIYTATFVAVSAGIVFFFINESFSQQKPSNIGLGQLGELFRDRIFIVFCVLGALSNVVYSQLYGLLSVYTEYVGLQPYAFGVLFAVNGGMVVAFQIPIRKVTLRMGSEKAFAIAQFLFAAGFSYFMLSKDLFHFLVGAVILTVGEITFYPASSGFIANRAPADKRGRYMALTGLFFGVGGSVGALIGFRLYGVLLHKELVWGILGAVGFATLPGYMYLLNAKQRKQSSSSQVISKKA